MKAEAAGPRDRPNHRLVRGPAIGGPGMDDAPRWVIAVVVALFSVGLVAFARGRDGHRGDDIGERAVAAADV